MFSKRFNSWKTILNPNCCACNQLGIYVISVSTPLLKDNKFIGVLTADLDFEIFQKELAALFPLANGSAFLMVDGKNILDQTEQILDFSDTQTKEIARRVREILEIRRQHLN